MVSVGEVDECWLWMARLDRDGYGRFKLAGKSLYAHRVAYQMAVGQIAAGLFVCHHCDNPPCCNPAHLFLGTPADNAADMARKGRADKRFGDHNTQAKLSIQDSRQAHELLSAGESLMSVAERLGVSRSTIYNIATGRHWSRRVGHG